VDQNEREMNVGKLFAENKLLMDLTAQPDYIQELIDVTVDMAVEDPGKYSHFHFLRFCKKFELGQISQNLERYMPMLSGLPA
jgi:hypothetical protein